MKTPRSPDPPRTRLRRRILVLEADETTRRTEARLATRAAFIVDTAGDLAGAWRTLCKNHYDLLIASSHILRRCGHDCEWWLHDAGVTVPVILTRGTVPVGVINPSGQPATWFSNVRRQHFRRGGLLALIRRILGSAAARSPRRAPVAA